MVAVQTGACLEVRGGMRGWWQRLCLLPSSSTYPPFQLLSRHAAHVTESISNCTTKTNGKAGDNASLTHVVFVLRSTIHSKERVRPHQRP